MKLNILIDEIIKFEREVKFVTCGIEISSIEHGYKIFSLNFKKRNRWYFSKLLETSEPEFENLVKNFRLYLFRIGLDCHAIVRDQHTGAISYEIKRIEI